MKLKFLSFYLLVASAFANYPFTEKWKQINSVMVRSQKKSLSSLKKYLVPNYSENSDEYKQKFSSDYDFSGMVQIGRCSGSLISLKDNQFKKALVLTNDHCQSFQRPGSIANVPVAGRVTLLNSLGNYAATLNLERIVYSSMVHTDIAIYELKETYEEIMSRYGIAALQLSKEAPSVGEAVSVISSYHVSGSSCRIDAITHEVKEYHWTWKNSIRYGDGCRSYSGVSGSPVVSNNLREVVAINNTSYNGGKACSFGNPCEVDENGNILTLKRQAYAQNTFWVYDCIDEKEGKKLMFDFDNKGCLLDKP